MQDHHEHQLLCMSGKGEYKLKRQVKYFLIWIQIQNKLHFLIIRCEVFLVLHEKTFEAQKLTHGQSLKQREQRKNTPITTDCSEEKRGKERRYKGK